MRTRSHSQRSRCGWLGIACAVAALIWPGALTHAAAINGAIITGSSYVWTYENILDGSINNDQPWLSAAGATLGDQWLIVDLRQHHTLNSMTVYNNDRTTGRGMRDVQISYADTYTGTYTPLGTYEIAEDDGVNGNPTTITFSPTINARFLRIDADDTNPTWGNTDYIGLSELTFDGTPLGDPQAVVPVSATASDEINASSYAASQTWNRSGMGPAGHSDGTSDAEWLAYFDADGYIEWDLGGTYSLASMRVWNGNGEGNWGTGDPALQVVDVYVKYNGGAWTLFQENLTLANAPQAPYYWGDWYDLEADDVTHVKFEIDSNYGNVYMALSEIEFNTPASTPGTVAFASAEYGVEEGDSGTTNVTITVTRSGGTAGAIDVYYTNTAGTAVADVDYVASTVTGKLSWADGVGGPTNFTVTIKGDTDIETPDDTLVLTLTNATAGVTIGAQSSTTITITNDDASANGILQFSSATYGVVEGDADTTSVTVTVVRTSGSTGEVTVDYMATNGTVNAATAGTDFVYASNTLTFADSVLTQTFAVVVNGDASSEPDETIALSLFNAGGGATLGAPSAATLTITNDDFGVIAFDSSTYSVDESFATAATATITVVRSGTNGAASVSYTTGDGTANQPGDYATASGTLDFADGQSSNSFEVVVTADIEDEDDETITLTLISASEGASLGAQSTAVLTIVDAGPGPIQDVGCGAPYDGEGVYNATVRLVDGSGVDGDKHDDAVGNAWYYRKGGANDPWLRFDLDSIHTIDSIKIWNHNRATPTRSVQDFTLWVSDTGEWGSYTQVGGTYTLEQGPNDPNVDIATNIVLEAGTSGRFVLLTNITNYGATDYIGLSEVQFFGTDTGEGTNITISTIDVSSELGGNFVKANLSADLDTTPGDSGKLDHDCHDKLSGNSVFWLGAAYVTQITNTFDLGSAEALGAIRIWNYNGGGGRAVEDLSLWVSTDGNTWTSAGSHTLAEPQTTDTRDISEILPLNGVTARHVQLRITSNYLAGYTGLAEVEVIAPRTLPPQQGTLILLR